MLLLLEAEVKDIIFYSNVFPKVLKQKNSYMKHMVNVHKKGFECSVCQKIIATEEGLKLHKRDQHKIQIQVL